MKASLLAVLLLPSCPLPQLCAQEKPIPREWFAKFGLNANDPQIREKDSDGDGFTNEEEWRAETNPIQKESHPPYHTKLFLKQWIRTPFRLKFQAYDGDPKNPEKMTFQINALDLRQPSEFQKIGGTVKGTTFKIISFKFKEVRHADTCDEDVSELTIRDTETGDDVRLTLGMVVDHPTSYARFAYYLIGDGISDGVKPFEFMVARFQEFVLRPDVVSHYKLLDVKETQAVIQTPDGKECTVPVRSK